jgi:exopolysaccharide biosynthesis WecB/TagA/CpsF family protein
MRIALAHDWLDSTLGGSERVLIELANLYPQAPIYTLLFDQERYKSTINCSRIETSILQRLPAWVRRHHKYLLPLIPYAVSRLRISQCDVILSSSNGLIKSLKSPPATLHICYCHTPARFIWEDRAKYLKEHSRWWQRGVAEVVSRLVRGWDYRTAQRVNVWLANSGYTALRLADYYGVRAQVVYPPVDTEGLQPYFKDHKQGFYVTLSTLARYKNIELVIRAFNDNGRRLIVIGEGPDRSRLEKLATGNIEFTGWVSEHQKATLLSDAQALIYPSVEDFGIAPVEAMAVGTPVVAYRRGGLEETIKEHVTGLFFRHQTPRSLNEALLRLEGSRLDAKSICAHAHTFSRQRFLQAISEIVEQAVLPKKQSFYVGDIRIDGLSIDQAIEHLLKAAQDRGQPPIYVVQPHVEVLEKALRDPVFSELLNGAELSLPNSVASQWALFWRAQVKKSFGNLVVSGLRIVFASRKITHQLPQRFNSETFTWPLLHQASKHNLKIFLVGGPKNRDITDIAKFLREQIPGITIVGTVSGRSPEGQPKGHKIKGELLQALNRDRPDIVLVALGFPLQERVMQFLANQLRHGVLIGEGGTFDYRQFGGHLRRAPDLLQRMGLEWLWRLVLEPRRFRRQLAVPRFIWRVYRLSR